MILYERDADPAALAGQHVAVVGYGNQGRSWALNLRDAGLDISVHVRSDETARNAEADGFAVADIAAAGQADVICLLVPDDVIPSLGLCADCRHCRRIRSNRGSVFVRCAKADTDPAYPRYPRVPVTACAAYESAAARDAPAMGTPNGSGRA